MLPDYTKAKEKVHEKSMNRVEKRSRLHTGPFSQAPIKPIFEGDRLRIERADGSVDDGPIRKFEVKLKISPEEIEQMSPNEIYKKYDDAAAEMGHKLSNHFYKELIKVTEEAGTIVDGKGEPFSMEKYFQMLEKVEIDFKPNGEPELPTIVAGEKLAKKINKILSEAFSNPEYKAKYEEIIKQKRLKWRDRENSRKLVG